MKDVPVGPGRQQYMHTITAGDASNPPMVLLPGYGAGAGFYFRCACASCTQLASHATGLDRISKGTFSACRHESGKLFVGLHTLVIFRYSPCCAMWL
jgi:hypothetical protein